MSHLEYILIPYIRIGNENHDDKDLKSVVVEWEWEARRGNIMEFCVAIDVFGVCVTLFDIVTVSQGIKGILKYA